MSEITSTTLACGMPLVVEEMPGVRSASVSWLLPAGSAAEPAEREGLSAMWAEVLFRGAGERSSREFADAMDRLGASRSSSAGALTLALGATAIGARLPGVLALLADMARRPRIEEEAVEPTRDLCLQALESLRDDPQERAVIAARARHLPAPFNRSGLGTEAGLKAVTRDDLLSGWVRLARPGRAVLGVAGAVNAAEVAAWMNELLQGWSGTTPEPAPSGAPPRGYAHEQDATNQVQIVVMHDAPPDLDNEESLLEKVVISVLSGGMAGRLFSEVREKRGLCYSVSAGYRGDRLFGSVTAYVGTTPERAGESLKVLLGELERINTPAGKVTQEEFRRAVVGMKSNLIFSGESTAARASALASDQRKIGRPRSLDEMARKVDALTVDRVNAYLAGRRLGKPTVQTLGPRALESAG